MPVRERVHYYPKKKNKIVMVCVALLCVAAVLLTGLTIYTVLQENRIQHAVESQQAQMDEMMSQNAEMQAALSSAQQHQSSLNEKMESLESKLSSASSQIASQSKEIKKKDKTIKSMQTRISLNDAGKTTVVTKDQDLPDRDYPDYKGKKLVALTFDDGPGPYTERLLDEMKKRDVRATFFLLGVKVDNYPELVKRMAEEGHAIGNHSNNHENLSKLSLSGIESTMDKAAGKIKKLVGHNPEVMRCPGGACNDTVKKYAQSAGIPITYWDVDTRDWESRNVNAILKVCFGEDGIEDGSIVLLHDIHKPSVDASIKLMDRLIEEGYTFVTVPELIMAREGKIVAGKVY